MCWCCVVVGVDVDVVLVLVFVLRCLDASDDDVLVVLCQSWCWC